MLLTIFKTDRATIDLLRHSSHVVLVGDRVESVFVPEPSGRLNRTLRSREVSNRFVDAHSGISSEPRLVIFSGKLDKSAAAKLIAVTRSSIAITHSRGVNNVRNFFRLSSIFVRVLVPEVLWEDLCESVG